MPCWTRARSCAWAITFFDFGVPAVVDREREARNVTPSGDEAAQQPNAGAAAAAAAPAVAKPALQYNTANEESDASQHSDHSRRSNKPRGGEKKPPPTRADKPQVLANAARVWWRSTV